MSKVVLMALLGLVAGASAQPFLQPEASFFGIPGLDCLCIGFGQAQAAQSASLRAGFEGSGELECTPHEVAYYAGGTYGICVELRPQGKRPAGITYTGISDWTWPAGLRIEVSQVAAPDVTFEDANALRTRSAVPDAAFRRSEALQAQLALEYHVTRMQAMLDSLWRATGQAPQVLAAPEYHFAFRIPAELAGSYLCARVNWDHPRYGLLRSDPFCIKVVEPCSEAALHRMWTTHVLKAWEQRNYERALALADSFLALSWREREGLVWAQLSARELRRYDDALRLLDLCFEQHGSIELPLPGIVAGNVTSQAARRLYQQNRQELLQLKNQQQQR